MPQTIINNGQQKMDKTLESLKKELQTVKTGRANPSVLNKVEVVYYGSPMPLNQIATISAPEAQILMIKPFDKNILKDIEKAILVADLNLTPQSDGSVIRIVFPPLTEQTRKQLVKELKTNSENNKVAIRNIRRDIISQLEKLEKEGLITEDELKRKQEEVQKLTDKYVLKVEEAIKILNEIPQNDNCYNKGMRLLNSIYEKR